MGSSFTWVRLRYSTPSKGAFWPMGTQSTWSMP